MNPRRPTPAGLERNLFLATPLADGNSFPSDGVADSATIRGNPKTPRLAISPELVSGFEKWLRLQGTGDKTVRNYVGYLSKALGLPISRSLPAEYFKVVGFGKKSYEALSRFLTYLSKVHGLEDLVKEVKRSMPKKPRSGVDTKVPSDSDIEKLRDSVARLGNPALTAIYNILVASGSRLSEAYTLVKTFTLEKLVKVGEDFYRYHLDYIRGAKRSYVIYLPAEVVNQIKKLRESDAHIPHLNNIAKEIERCGLGVKYIRKWFRQLCKRLRIDSEVIEFIQGRVTALGVGAKHYTDLIALSDEEYPKILNKITSFLIKS